MATRGVNTSWQPFITGNDVRHMDFIDDHLLMTDFSIYPLEYEVIKEDVEPLYIIDIDEDITSLLSQGDVRMAVDQGQVENIDV